MNKQISKPQQHQTLINEMKSMLNAMPGKRGGLLEAIIYGEDGEEMMDNGEGQSMPQEPGMPQGGQQMPQEQQMSQESGMPQGGQQMSSDETNPLDEDPAIAKLITGIRIQTLEGLHKLAENPESAQYELLKKIFLLIDKAVEDKVSPEK